LIVVRAVEEREHAGDGAGMKGSARVAKRFAICCVGYFLAAVAAYLALFPVLVLNDYLEFWPKNDNPDAYNMAHIMFWALLMSPLHLLFYLPAVLAIAYFEY
jgi:hypothetical protein